MQRVTNSCNIILFRPIEIPELDQAAYVVTADLDLNAFETVSAARPVELHTLVSG
jgi:hypothetical protein